MYRTKVAMIVPLILQFIAFLDVRPHRREGARRLQAEVVTMLRKLRKLAAPLAVLCGTFVSTDITFGEPPETVLDSRGLRKVKKFYVVATEDEIGRSFNNILPVYDAIARLKSQAHWQSDVIAGWALGTGVGYWTSTWKTPLTVRILPGGVSIGLSKRF